ncbi:hypothetical protein L2E82_02528 [Cichorium intybus]|uniref:Uncharacterized protein n=1 Tax=Cichorium intybus TaxID=13427 RepID=A0ACB9H3I1_CICIN|nr:hypothetical protein L2E82_02528 [Cichorium intybus]
MALSLTSPLVESYKVGRTYGAISNVTLGQPNASRGTLTYEDQFDVLSLSKAFVPNENLRAKTWSGGMSVSLAGPNGRVLSVSFCVSLTKDYFCKYKTTCTPPHVTEMFNSKFDQIKKLADSLHYILQTLVSKFQISHYTFFSPIQSNPHR